MAKAKSGSASSRVAKGRPGEIRRRRKQLIVLGPFVAISVLVAGWLFLPTRSSPPSDPPDIILVTIDTLRADAVGYSGNHQTSTPFLDELAGRGIAFLNAHAHNVITLPSHTNILTGLLPYEHGVRDNEGFTLDPRFETIATRLKANGYRTGAFVGAFPLDARFGLNRGFEVYDDHYSQGEESHDFELPERPASEVLAAARHWYDTVRGQKKFLWLHLYDPHAPYQPREPFASRFPKNPYLGEVAATDDALGSFLRPILAARPNTVVVVTGDHGEALGDHGELTHGLFAYEATLKVPLIVYIPHGAHRVESHAVWHIDIAPTILELARTSLPPNLEGHSLLDVRSDRPGYFEALSASMNRGWAPLTGLIRDGNKYIDLPLPELYDLPRDPAERVNLVSQTRRVVAALRSELAARASKALPLQRSELAAERARLLSLGYLSGSSTKSSYGLQDDPKNLIELDRDIHRSIDLYQRHKLGEAIDVAKRVVATRPDMAVGAELLAFFQQEAERGGEAIATLEKAVKGGTATDAMKIRLGLVLVENGRARDAVAVLAPFEGRTDPDILNAYGIALADSGDVNAAVRQFSRVLKGDPENALAYQNLGITALKAGEGARAEGYLRHALTLDRRLPLAWNTLGVILAGRNDSAGAIEVWKKAVALDPQQYDALFNIGVVAQESGRAAEAREALEQFVRTAPKERYARDLTAAAAQLRRLKAAG